MSALRVERLHEGLLFVQEIFSGITVGSIHIDNIKRRS